MISAKQARALAERSFPELGLVIDAIFVKIEAEATSGKCFTEVKIPKPFFTLVLKQLQSNGFRVIDSVKYTSTKDELHSHIRIIW